MSAVFNCKRFTLLVKSDLLLHWKYYLLGYVAVLSGMFLFMLFFIAEPLREAQAGATYSFVSSDDDWFGFVVAMVAVYFLVLVVSSFGNLKDKTRRLAWLMLPVTAFEKFLHQFLMMVVILGGALYVALWIDAQLVRNYIIWHYELPGEVIAAFTPYRFFTPLSEAGSLWEQITMVLIVVSLASYFMMANIWFRRFGWIKILVFLVVAIYLFSVLITGLSYLFNPELTTDFRAYLPFVPVPGTDISFFQVYMYTMVDIAWVFLLLMGYYKLKETEL
jgi:hypothetical protein